MPFTKGHPQYFSFKGKKHTQETRKKLRKAHLGKKLSKEHRNKISLAGKGRIVTKETREKIAESQRGNKHPNWKGNKVSYRTLHNWIVNNWGKADHCEHCETQEAKVYDWANISKQYYRVRNDWKQLCRSCHIKYDDTPEKKEARRKNLEKGWNRIYANT